VPSRSSYNKVDPYSVTAWQCSNKKHAVRSDVVSFIRHLRSEHNLDLQIPEKSAERIAVEALRES